MESLNISPDAVAQTSAPLSQDYYDSAKAALMGTIQRGTNWFYWIAALSLLNTVIAFVGANLAFGLGMGITQIFDAFTTKLEGPLKVIPLVVGFVTIGVFALFGYLGGKGQLWVIVLGTVLYLLDGLLLLALMALSGELLIVGVLIHGLALYHLFNSIGACRRLKQTEAEQAALPPPAPPMF